MEEKETKQDLLPKTKTEVEKLIKTITENGLQIGNVDVLYKLIDIHKDIENEKYWENKEENMRYLRDDYREDYRGGRSRDSRGRYMGRGHDEGEEMIDEMREHYGNYMCGGRYNGAEKEKAFDYMLQSAEEFFGYLMEEVENPEQMEKIKRTAKRISDMRM